MEKEKGRQGDLKIIFSLISLLLMLPPLINNDNSYYRTLFIFLINRVIDLFFAKENHEKAVFIAWSLLNQWLGAFACVLAFCSLVPEFLIICQSFSSFINIGLFVSAVSCVLLDLVLLIYKSIKESQVLDEIKKESAERNQKKENKKEEKKKERKGEKT